MNASTIRQKDRVSVAIGRTINCGNFESIRVDISFSSDVRKDEKVSEAFARVEKQVEDKLVESCGQFEQQPKKKEKRK